MKDYTMAISSLKALLREQEVNYSQAASLSDESPRKRAAMSRCQAQKRALNMAIRALCNEACRAKEPDPYGHQYESYE